MADMTDMERRISIRERMDNGKMLPAHMLATEYGVAERTIWRDLKWLRSDNSHWLDESTNDLMIHLFRETWNGYFTDLAEIQKLIDDPDMKPREKEVQCQLIRERRETRKEQLGLLMKMPVAWRLDKLAKSREIVNVTKEMPQAIYGELQKNTHITPSEIPAQEPPKE